MLLLKLMVVYKIIQHHDFVKAGADMLVSGSYIFNSPHPIETIKSLKELSRRP